MKTGSTLDKAANKGLPGPGSYNVAGGVSLKYKGGSSTFGSSKRAHGASTNSFV